MIRGKGVVVIFWQGFIVLVGIGLFLFGFFGIALQEQWGIHPVYLYFWIMSGPFLVALALLRLHEIRKDFRKGKEETRDPERGDQEKTAAKVLFGFDKGEGESREGVYEKISFADITTP